MDRIRLLYGSRTILWGLYLSAAVLCLASMLRAGEDKEKSLSAIDLVDGAVARSEAVFSGRIEFQHIVTDAEQNVKAAFTKNEVVYFSAPSWAVVRRGDKAPDEISHRGKHVVHHATPQETGEIRHTADVEMEQRVNSLYPRLPVFAGSFWERSTRDFVRANRNKGVYKGRVEVNGVATRILEWAVSDANKYKAFDFVAEVTEHGGTLRLYIAPQLGFVLPRIEHLGTSGRVAVRYDSFDFYEVAPGIFFPKRSRWSSYNRTGSTGFSEFKLLKVDKVNEPIADDIFKVYLPVGTIVADGRAGNSSHIFRIAAAGTLPVDGLDDVVAVGSPPSDWMRPSVSLALIVGAVVGLVAAAALVLFRRWRRLKG